MAKNKILIFRIVLITVIGIIGFYVSETMIYDDQDVVVTLQEEDFSFIKGYEALENYQYKMVSDDPQMIANLKDKHLKLQKVKVVFAEPVKQDIPVQVFYKGKFTKFAEINSLTTIVEEGDMQAEFKFDLVQCSYLRLDINGDFQYGAIELSGLEGKINLVSTCIYYLCLCIFLIGTWILVSEKLGILFFKMVKSLLRIMDAIYSFIQDFASGKGIHIEHIFCILALIYGIFMAFLIPPDQIPDELTHYRQMTEAAGFPKIEKQIENFFYVTDVGDMQGNPLVTVDKVRLREHFSDHFDKTQVRFTKPSISIVTHLPAAILFFIGYFLDCPVYCCLIMAEMGSLLFYVVMGYLSLKYMPIKKELLCGILLLPMTVQQCASVNYDAVLIPTCIFLTAYVFHCKYVKDRVSWKELFLFFVIFCVVMLTRKPTYLPLFLQIFLIPLDKWHLKIGKRFDVLQFMKRFRWALAVMGIALFVLILYVGRNNIYIQLVEACVLRPDLVFSRIYNTMKEFHSAYFVSMIGHLGWLDILMPAFFYNFVKIFLFVFGQQREVLPTGNAYKIKWKEKLYVIMIVLVTIYLILIAMFTWTMFLYDIDTGGTLKGMIEGIQKINVSLGVQGRYFLPFLFLCFLPFDRLFKVGKRTLFYMQCLYYPVVIIWSLLVVAQRYWI